MTLRSGFTLGDWTIHPLEGRLVNDDDERRIQPKSMDVLLCLANAGGAVVERDKLLRDVWGDRAVTDEPLTRCIGELRRGLGDTRSDPEYILTVPKRGYRLLHLPVALVDEKVADGGQDHPRPTLAQQALRTATLKKIAIGFGVLILAALVQIGVERVLDSSPIENASITEADPRSIAVLPFVDMTAKQDHAYFGDGLAEELINLLAKNSDLLVVARTSSFSLRDASMSAQEIAQQLQVKHVVEGSVRRDGDNFRITAQLIIADSGYQVWTETFDETSGDIFLIQDRIAEQTTVALQANVMGGIAEALRTDPQAYELYLQAKYRAQQGSKDDFERAVEFLKAALTIDPDYAPAWAQLADVYSNLGGQGLWDWDEGFKLAHEAALRAVEVGPEHPGGYQQLAWIAHRYNGDLDVSMQHMQKALALKSWDIDILRNAAVLLLQVGRLNKAIEVLEYCAARSPIDPRGFYNLGTVYKYANRLAEAEQSYRKTIALSSEYRGARYGLAETLLFSGRADEALEIWKGLDGYRVPKGIALASHDLNRKDESDAALDKLIAGWGEQFPDTVADVYAYRGDVDEAFAMLELDYEKFGAAGWGEFKLQPILDNLKSDPRWESFLERGGATDEQLSRFDLKIDLPSP